MYLFQLEWANGQESGLRDAESEGGGKVLDPRHIHRPGKGWVCVTIFWRKPSERASAEIQLGFVERINDAIGKNAPAGQRFIKIVQMKMNSTL